MPFSVLRDPFARGEYIRTTHSGPDTSCCQWCGNKRPRMYSYDWEHDDRACGKFDLDSRQFCRFECFQTFYR